MCDSKVLKKSYYSFPLLNFVKIRRLTLPSLKEDITKFRDSLKKRGVISTIRKSIKVATNRVSKSFRPYEAKIYKQYLENKNRVIPLELVEVPTKKINKRLKTKKERVILNKILIPGMISSTTQWNTVNLDKYHHSEAMKERFVEDKKWEDTIYYDYFKNKKNGHYRKCESWTEFKEKVLTRWDELYKDIKNNGFKQQKKLLSNKSIRTEQDYKDGKIENEVMMAINSNGEILQAGNGIHRFMIAKILGIEMIPAIIVVWHKQYIDWVRENTDIDKITPKTAIQPILDGKAEEISG